MIVLNNLAELSSLGDQPDVGLTIGNFDGVHIGHQQLLKKIKSDCISRGLKFVVVTFIPHPQKILQPGKERFLINSYDQRRLLLEKWGVDVLVEITFTRDFSTLTPEDFLRKHLLVYPGLKNLYLGYDFAFGANKQGGYDLAQSMCGQVGVTVEIQPKFELDGQVISSSLIRDKLLQGELAQIQKILGRSFYLEGVVIKGEGRGKKIGFPTANIQVSQDLIVPQRGVYVTRTNHKGMIYQSVTNIGHNPTFKTGSILHIETHLFDFDTDIYGEALQIEFLHKVRDEKKFSTVNDLIEQIKADVAFARTYQKEK